MTHVSFLPHLTPETIRNNWKQNEVLSLFELPFQELLYQAQTIHRQYFPNIEIQISTLLSIKTGGCSEDCAYCPQSAHYDTGLKANKLMDVDTVLTEAKKAKSLGSSRFCMGAAWRNPKERDMPKLVAMVQGVKALGLETCMTLGMLEAHQAKTLKEAGLDYYNHNLDTSEEYYDTIITTRTYQDRLDTLAHVRDVGMNVCCGGIVGMGESRNDRAAMLQTLANLPEHPQSVPINHLVSVEGTPLATVDTTLDNLEFVRTVAVARIMMPKSMVRLSAGREDMSDEMQALCFMAGANSVFYGEKLLTTHNPTANEDQRLFERLGLKIMKN